MEEINRVQDAFDWAVSSYGNENVMIMGDYNAGCTYVKLFEWPQIPLKTNATYQWLFADNIFTNINCDRELRPYEDPEYHCCPYDR